MLLVLLQELGIKIPHSILCDNLGATHLSFNLIQLSRMKHIQIDLHFIRDVVQKDTLNVYNIHSQDQLANLMTKQLSQECIKFYEIRLVLLMEAQSRKSVFRKITQLKHSC